MYKNYIFDLYGTLIDIHTNEKKQSLWKYLCEFYGFQGAFYTPKELRTSYEELIKEAFASSSPYEFPEIKIEPIFETLYTKKGVHTTEDLICHTAQFFRILSTSYIRLYDGALDLLQSLKEAGGNIFVLSNAQRAFTEYELKLLGIYDIFNGIILSSDEGCMKPDPNFFELAISRFRLDKSESIMIGNDSISDIKGAHDIGLDSLYLHSSLSPDITSPLLSNYQFTSINLPKVKELLLKL